MVELVPGKTVSAEDLIALCKSALGSVQAPKSVDFGKQIAPIFTKYCNGCHNETDLEGGLSLESFTQLQEGGAETIEARVANVLEYAATQVLLDQHEQQLAEREGELLAPIFERVDQAIQSVAREQGLDIVLRSQAGPLQPIILYVNEDKIVNITPDVARKLGLEVDESAANN